MELMDKMIEDFKNGEIIIIFDDEKRENEADMVVAIDKLTPEKVNFIVTHAKGLLCAAISNEIAVGKGFPLMPDMKQDKFSTAFTISIDSIKVKTGISSLERYTTAKELVNPETTLKDFVTPGHLFPVVAKKGLLHERNGHTEAAVSLCRWAGITEAALICEMVAPNGNMCTKDEAKEFAEKNNIAYCTVEDLIEYQNLRFSNVERVVAAKLTTDYGIFDITIYNELCTDKEHIFLSMGDFKSGLVRVHSECFTGDVLSSRTCDCRYQLNEALRIISEDGKGALVYLRQEGRGIGLGEKIKAYALQQNNGLDTVEANEALGHKIDDRDFHQAAWILKDQGFEDVRLMTNNPEKVEYLERHGLKVKMESIETCVRPENYKYLYTKKTKMGHKIKLEGAKKC
jgi:3,4-dihydroxy 2-butanone 4-phosphate synthase / GTP cyclohydrolase II